MRLLFITSTRIGDAVLSTGVLQHLIERHPDMKITVAVGRPAAPLFESVPGLERILIIDKRSFNLHWLDLWRVTVVRRWDLVIDLRASALACLLFAGRRLVVGRSDDDRRRVMELAALLDLDSPPAPTVWLAEASETAAARLISDNGPVLAIAPAANWPGKQWRPDRFAALAEGLAGRDGVMAGARVAVIAAANERAQAQPVLDSLPENRAIDLVGVDLPTSAACLRRCRLFVGNDSGLMHLSAAAGVPTLGLFGPSSDRRYAPWGPLAAFVRTEESVQDLHAQRAAPGQIQETLMDGLPIAAALEAAEDLWRRTGPGPAPR